MNLHVRRTLPLLLILAGLLGLLAASLGTVSISSYSVSLRAAQQAAPLTPASVND